MTEHILNPTTVRFLFDLATKNERISVPDADTLDRMAGQGWITMRRGKLPSITPKGEMILALLKYEAGVA